MTVSKRGGERRPPAPIGLCGTCSYRETVKGARSSFTRCGRSRTDPAFPRYPRLPVTACAGYDGVIEHAAADSEHSRSDE